MSKTRVFIYGSCVSRDTFEHLDPEQFELVQYVARQSALSAYTRPVELVAPPALESRFQQRMIAGDFASSLRSLIPQAADSTDLLLVDLVDERLGVYLLPDGSVVTRSVELISSGAEQTLPSGTQHIAFGTQQHFEYWSGAIAAVGDLVRKSMPRAAVALLDIPWAEWSESGEPTPDSFGVTAAQANPVFAHYVRTAAQALGAHVISVDSTAVVSGPHHPWGEAPFHYAERVYLDAVRQLTGAEGRIVWGPGSAPRDTTGGQPSVRPSGSGALRQAPPESTRRQAISAQPGTEPSEAQIVANQVAAIHAIMKDALPGRWRKHWLWAGGPASVHEFELDESVLAFDITIHESTCDVQFLPRDKSRFGAFRQRIESLGIEFHEVAGKPDRVSIAMEPIPDGVVNDPWVNQLRNRINSVRETFEKTPAEHKADQVAANQIAAIHATMRKALPGLWRKHWLWAGGPASVHEFELDESVLAFDITVHENICDVQFFPRDKSRFGAFRQRIESLGIEFHEVAGKPDRISIAMEPIPDGIVNDPWIHQLRNRINSVKESFERAPSEYNANGYAPPGLGTIVS